MGKRGIALVVVMWALLLVGAIAMSFSFAMRTEAQAARNGADGTRAYFMARTGINRAIMMLSSLPADNVLREAIAGEEEDAGYAVAVETESGRIDVNLASEDLLKGALKASGLAEEEAESVGDAILDWRDDDDRPRPRGAEKSDYAALPDPIAPRNGPLGAVDELREVKGVTPRMYRDLLARIFTVHGRSPLVNVNAAPPEVLRALGASAEQAERIVAQRTAEPFRSPAELSAFTAREGIPQALLPRLGVASASNVYSLAARGTAGDGVVRVVRALVEVGGAGRAGVRVVRWEDLAAAGEDSP